jgi:hypothetical protein
MSDPRMLALQSGLLTIARSHPDARAEIIVLLRNLDSKTDIPSVSPTLIEGGIASAS